MIIQQLCWQTKLKGMTPVEYKHVVVVHIVWRRCATVRIVTVGATPLQIVC